MDEFGVLVQSIGFKGHGKSAPMAKSKTKPNSHFSSNSGVETLSFNDSSSLPVDELDGIFRSNASIDKSKQPQNLFGDDDVFGVTVSVSNQYEGIDLDLVLNSSNNGNDTIILDSRKSAGSDVFDDFWGSTSKQSDPVDDLLGNFGVNPVGKPEKKALEFDDLISGVGGADSSTKGSINGEQSKTSLSSESNDLHSKSRMTVEDDPFLVFELSVSQSDASWSFTGPLEQGKDTVESSFDELDDFAMGRPYNDSKAAEVRTTTERSSADTSSNGFENVDVLDAIFNGTVKQNHVARPTSTAQNSLFDSFFQEEKVCEDNQTSSCSSSVTNPNSSTASVGSDFISLFGDVTASSGVFHEIEGELDIRRRARLNRHMRTNARMAKALNDKNQRDFQSQLEQEEKHRFAETVDNDIKRWAAGKEGNLRALLSSLQQVLWPECGWNPVSLTDMITSDSVKKVYKKATLYVHPDKVQQKGANIRQKYIAEKVFDILKEACNKFSAEELR